MIGIVFLSHKDSPALVGLAISYVLSVQDRLSGVVSSFTETEKEMISVERIVDYVQRIPFEEEDYEMKQSTNHRCRNRSAASIRSESTYQGWRKESVSSRISESANQRARGRSLVFSPSFDWPSAGEIVFEDATLVYATSVSGGDGDLGSSSFDESMTMTKVWEWG